MGRFGSARGVRRALVLIARLGLGWLGQSALIGCSPSVAGPSPPLPSAARVHVAASTASVGGAVFDFPEVIRSPSELDVVASDLAPFLNLCKRGDAALARVAERFARRQSEGQRDLDVSEVSFALRAEGSPYVWPRAWTLEGSELSSPASVARMRAWLDTFGDGGERRCGVALVSGAERSVLVAVAVDALADLEPLAVRQRAGSWVEVNASVLVPTDDAKLLVLGPSGTPHAVPTVFDGGHARARFHADRPGAFLVQLLASVAGGPRPVLEATVYADVSPPRSFFGDRAPGEPSAPLPHDADRDAALFEMVNEARRSEGRSSLRRDPDLDAIAERHADAMRRIHRIAHDAGDGDPQARVEAARLTVLSTGENVAHNIDVTRAHRALWASPSHRENLLEPRYDRVGIGTVLDPDGSLWVCEVFADFAN